jgi:hypothetical protein
MDVATIKICGIPSIILLGLRTKLLLTVPSSHIRDELLQWFSTMWCKSQKWSQFDDKRWGGARHARWWCQVRFCRESRDCPSLLLGCRFEVLKRGSILYIRVLPIGRYFVSSFLWDISLLQLDTSGWLSSCWWVTTVHDLNTPTSIISMSWLLLRMRTSDEGAGKFSGLF